MRLGWSLAIWALTALETVAAATIHEVIDQGDSIAVAAMLDTNSALLNDRLPNGRTPLHTAAYGGKLGIVQLLLSRGADPNAMTTAGSTPLHGAAIGGHEAVVKLLTEKGANVNVTNQGGYTPLTNATLSGSTQAMKCLLDAGANVEPTAAGGAVPLMCAINNFNPEAIDLLLDAGANPNTLSAEGEGAVTIATLMAIWRPDLAHLVPGVLRSLFEHGADANLPLPTGYTALMHATSASDTIILKTLIDGGADVNLVAKSGATAFGEAVEFGNLSCVQFLINKGARTDAVDINTGRTPLHHAVLRGDQPIVEAVLSVTPELNAIDSVGMAPLDMAVRYGYTRIADILRKAGARTNIKKEVLPSAIYFARQPQEGEAYLWYLGNCGYLIKTRNHCLIFDYWTQRMAPTEASLSNGFLNPSGFASQDVTVFVSHEHADHYDSTIFSWYGQIPRLKYVFGFVPDSLPENARQGYAGQPYEYLGPGMTKTIDKMQVMAVRSNDAGVGFVVSVDGLTIYHAGDLAGWQPNEREGFISQIDSIAAAVDSVDIALVNVTGCHHHDTLALFEGTAYTVTTLHPRLLIPTHGPDYIYRRFMNKLKTQFPELMSFCPIWRGDAVKYTGGVRPTEVDLL